jgi:hypothetical protein
MVQWSFYDRKDQIGQVKQGGSGRVQRQLCSAWELDSTSFAWDNRWGMPLEAAAVGAFAGDDVMPPPTSTIFQQARRWYRLHAFIRNVIHLKLGFFNCRASVTLDPIIRKREW